MPQLVLCVIVLASCGRKTKVEGFTWDREGPFEQYIDTDLVDSYRGCHPDMSLCEVYNNDSGTLGSNMIRRFCNPTVAYDVQVWGGGTDFSTVSDVCADLAAGGGTAAPTPPPTPAPPPPPPPQRQPPAATGEGEEGDDDGEQTFTNMFGKRCISCLTMDTCRYALDGECDEPRYCALGTDCTDCDYCGGHR
eukprot:SAG11_NODE_1647_length_4512_cov_6.823929_1_plen_191_part_10